MTRRFRADDSGEVLSGVLVVAVTAFLSGGLAVLASVAITEAASSMPPPVDEPLVNYDGS